MPIISTFFGIIIRMYFGDHNPPHFHAEFQGEKATIKLLRVPCAYPRGKPRGITAQKNKSGTLR